MNHMSIYHNKISLDPDLDEYLTEYQNEYQKQTPLEPASHYDGECFVITRWIFKLIYLVKVVFFISCVYALLAK